MFLKKLIPVAGLFLAFFFILMSCDISNPAEGLEVRIKTISRNTTIVLEIVDAASQFNIEQSVNVSFEGPGKDYIINSTNTPISDLSITEGVSQFSILDNINPSTNNPFELILVFQSEGYVSTSQKVNIISTGTTLYRIMMTNRAELPEGIVSNTVTEGVASGSSGTNQEISVSSGTETNTGASAKITVPAGTVLLGKDGQQLSGEIQTAVTYFNPVNLESLRQFPGGFNVNVTNEDGTSSDEIFVTAGFAAIDMTVGGEPVEKFSNGSPVVEMEIPTELINPETGEPVKPGDTVPLWSYDEDTGVWGYENTIQFEASPGKSRTLTTKWEGISHLSYYNLDWKRYNGDYCDFGLTVTLIPLGAPRTVYVELFLERVPGSGDFNWRYSGMSVSPYDPSIQFVRAPVDRATKIVLRFMPENQIILDTVVSNLCVPDGINVYYDDGGTPVQVDSVKISANVVCESTTANPKSIDIEGIPVFARQVDSLGTYIFGQGWVYIGTFIGGELPKTFMVIDSYYVFRIEYDGEWYHSLDYEPPFLIDRKVIHYDIIDDDRICDHF